MSISLQDKKCGATDGDVYRHSIPKGDQDLDELKSRIKQHISAKDAGLEFILLRERAMISAKGSINLGEYIGYFSFSLSWPH